MSRLFLLVAVVAATASALHDAEINGICSRNWDGTDDQLWLENSVCCDEELHKSVYKTMDRLIHTRPLNTTYFMDSMLAIAPSNVPTHILATEGVLAVSAPAPGPNFCKDRVGGLHVLIQQSPVNDPYTVPYSIPGKRPIVCNNQDLRGEVDEIIAQHKLPGKKSPAQIVRIFAVALSEAFAARFWLSLSHRRVAYHSNANTICEFPVGPYTLAAFTFQPIASRTGIVTVDKIRGESHSSSAPIVSSSAPIMHSSSVSSTTRVVTATSPVPHTASTAAGISIASTAHTIAPFEASSVLPSASIGRSEDFKREAAQEANEPKIKFGLNLRRQAGVGRGRLSGCGSKQLGEIMNTVLGPLLSVLQMKIGDIAKRLQNVAQATMGKSFEVLIAKGDFEIASHQMKTDSHCRNRIGKMFAMIYETPVPYNVNDTESEKQLGNIDFGEPLGGSGFLGQKMFPMFSELAAKAFNAGSQFSPIGNPLSRAGGLFGGGGDDDSSSGGGLFGR